MAIPNPKVNIWFTSDQHYDHTNVIKYCDRPFKDADHMNEMLIKNHNECVQPGDIVIHLGDFSLSARPVREILPRLNGTHYLIAGNHDRVHPAWHKDKPLKAQSAMDLYEGFEEIQLKGVTEIARQTVLMCHMPYSGDTHPTEDRYKDFRIEDNGLWLLHGHIHQNWKVRGKQINVGVDVWDFKPVHVNEIAKIIKDGT